MRVKPRWSDGISHQRQAGFSVLALGAKPPMNVRTICAVKVPALVSILQDSVTTQGVNALAVVCAVWVVQAKIHLLIPVDEPDNRCVWGCFHS